MENKTVISLFDESGEWSWPYEQAGFDVYRFDIKNGYDINDFCVEYLNDNFNIHSVYAILAAPPCTHFTCSGNRFWAEKDADGRTDAMVDLVIQALATIEYFQPEIWAIENPVGRMARLVEERTGFDMGQPFYFDPYQFAQLADVDNNRRMIEEDPQTREFYAKLTDAQKLQYMEERYTKKTGIWGNFNRPEFAELSKVDCPTGYNWMQRLGGKSDRTKEIRSKAPSGFARAFFNANCTPSNEIHEDDTEWYERENQPAQIALF